MSNWIRDSIYVYPWDEDGKRQVRHIIGILNYAGLSYHLEGDVENNLLIIYIPENEVKYEAD